MVRASSLSWVVALQLDTEHLLQDHPGEHCQWSEGSREHEPEGIGGERYGQVLRTPIHRGTEPAVREREADA